MLVNPSRTHLFKIQIDGIDNDWVIQKVTKPEISISSIKYGAGDHDVSVPSKVSYSNGTFEKLCEVTGKDTFGATWAQECISLPATSSAKNIIFSELNSDGVTVFRKWLWSECHCVKYKISDGDRMGDANTIETIEFSVSEVTQLS